VSEMSFEDFGKPSEMQGTGFGARPALAQMKGRLVHIRPTGREDNIPSKEAGKPPYTRLTCDVTFLSGEPIPVVLDKFGTVSAQIDPPVQAGQIMPETFVSQGWFVSRLKDKVGVPGFPGVLGILDLEKQKSGNSMWIMRDPTPEQMATAKQWFAWAMADRSRALYVPAAPAPQVAPVTPPVQYAQQAPASAPAGSPFAQPAAAPAPATGGTWQPSLPPGISPTATPVAAAPPAAQPGPDVPPWQR
jgi:hypothetical protein